MKVFYVFLLVLVFGVVSSHGRAHENNAAPTPFTTLVAKPYYEFFLVQQWPASFCRAIATTCPSIPPYFTVHGLWAQLKRGRSVTCTEKTFDISKLNPNTVSNLTKYWPNLFGKNRDKSFWGHEYDTHASCISPFQNNQDKFFSSTIKLAKELNVTTMLLEAGIDPGMKHSISDIKNAISNAIDVKPTLHCNKANDGTVQLYEIYLCVDKTTFKPQNCRKPDNHCPTQNSLISFPHPVS